VPYDQPQTTVDPTGRVRIIEKDDRGQPFSLFQSQPASVLGVGAFSEVLRLEMLRARRGQLFLAASIFTTTAFTNQYVAIAYNVVGFLGAAGSVLMRSGLTNTFPIASFEWEEPETYSALAIEARQIVDGVPSAVQTGIQTLNLTCYGFYWR
jgi:hypothetical protein